MSDRSGKNKVNSEEKLASLKAVLDQKMKLKVRLNDEIKEVQAKIEEIERFNLLQKTFKLKEVLERRGMSFEDFISAVEVGQFEITEQASS